MRTLRIVAFVLLAGSAAAFMTLVYVNSESNWRPAEVPLPGPGLAVMAPFEITTGGEFTIEATVPVAGTAGSGSLQSPPPADCSLEAEIDGPNALRK